jgi:hypothetical protein
MLQVPARDDLALRVRREPPLAVAQQLLDLVVADPVVLLVVQHRHQHVQVREQLGEPLRSRERDREVAAVAPLGRQRGIERVRLGRHRPPERLEQPAQELVAAAAGQHRDARLERDRRRRDVGPVLRLPAERRPIHLRDGDAQERRGDVRAIVHVLREQPALALGPAPPAHEPHRIHVEHERRGAPFGRGLGIHHVRLPERELEALRPRGVLVQQVAEVRRRPVRRRDGEQHGCARRVSSRGSLPRSLNGNRPTRARGAGGATIHRSLGSAAAATPDRALPCMPARPCVTAARRAVRRPGTGTARAAPARPASRRRCGCAARCRWRRPRPWASSGGRARSGSRT